MRLACRRFSRGSPLASVRNLSGGEDSVSLVSVRVERCCVEVKQEAKRNENGGG